MKFPIKFLPNKEDELIFESFESAVSAAPVKLPGQYMGLPEFVEKSNG